MKVHILKNEKNQIDVEIDNLTLVEILRVYLNKDASVEFAAWKREHYTKNPVLRIVTNGKTAKKALDDAVLFITKDLDKTLKEFSNLN